MKVTTYLLILLVALVPFAMADTASATEIPPINPNTVEVSHNPLVWLGVILIGGGALGGSCVAEEYTESLPTCQASPMCSNTYCIDNPQICNMFKGKTIDCCTHTFVM